MSFLPDKVDFTVWQGATFRKQIILYRAADPSPGQERDLTGYTAELIIRDKPRGTPIHTLSSSNGGIIVGTTDGVLELYMSAEDTALIEWKGGVYDLTITAPGGDTDAILYGGFKIRGV